MSRINYSDTIRAGGRQLYLQTNTLDDELIMVSTLFDGGRVLNKESAGYPGEVSEVQLENEVKEFHQTMLARIELLFEISARVKTVRHPVSLNKLGRLLVHWNLLDEAISELQLAIAYDTKYGEAYKNLGEAFLRRNSPEEAIDILEKGSKACPGYADLWALLGRAYLKNNANQKALDAIEKALKINPSYDEAHLALAIYCIKMHGAGGTGRKGGEEMLKQAQNHLNRAAGLSVRFQTREFEEAIRVFHRGAVGETLRILENVLDHLPKAVDTDFIDYFYLNYMYGERGRNFKDIQEHVGKLELLSRRQPRYADIHNQLGIGYLIECRHLFQKALRHFRAAVEINPEYERARSNMKLAENDAKGLLILLRALLK